MATTSREAFITFIVTNETTQFRNHLQAKLEIFDKMFTSSLSRYQNGHESVVFRHDRFVGEPYIFTRAKIVTSQKLLTYCTKTVFHLQ